MTQKDIPLSEITLPVLYKPEPESFSRLVTSIRFNGLFHPIILQGDSAPYKIIAGRARFLAVSKISEEVVSPTTIPATIYPANCPNPQEIALHENLRRNNLSWYEQVELEAELHKLRVEEHGEKAWGRPKTTGPEGWSQADTAKELGLAIGTLSQDLNLAGALIENPYLRNVKDKKTALKLIKNVVKRQEMEIESLEPSQVKMDEILLGPSEVILKTFPDETFDACITDPPWSEYRDEALRSDQEKLLPIFLEIYRVLKKNSMMYVITSTTDFFFYKRELPKLGFQVQSYPIIWNKPKTITHGRRPWEYARDYEPIIIAAKGSPTLTSGTELSSILKFDNVHSSKLIHPNEKPIDLMIELLRQCTFQGAKILDPFAGSGVTLEACKNTDRRYIGIEKEKKFFDLIERRLGK